MVRYCIVCFYKPDMKGHFTVDYIFRDIKSALTKLKNLSGENEYFHLFISESPRIMPGSVEDFHIYLDIQKKKLYICMNECSFNIDVLYEKLPLPPLS